MPSSKDAEAAGGPSDENLQPELRRAWLQVVGAFCIWFQTWGLLASFGIFQEFYGSIQLASPSSISWIGSTQGAILLFGSLLAGEAFDRGHLMALLWLGHGCIVIGLMLTSISTHYWHFILAQGVMVGLGASCLFLPSVSILQQYFDKRRSLATGLAATGNAIGGITIPLMVRSLLLLISFGWTVRIVAFLCLALSIPPLLWMRQVRASHSSTTTSVLDPALFHDAPYLAYCATFALVYAGTYVGLFYLPTFSLSLPGSTASLDSAVLTAANAGSLVGRLLPGLLADKIGPLNVMIPLTFGSALLSAAWLAVHNVAGLIVWAVCFGGLTAALVTLGGPAMVAFTPDLRQIGVRFGWFGCTAAIGMLVASPIAGRILESQGAWMSLQVWTCGLFLAATACMCLARTLKMGWTLRRRI